MTVTLKWICPRCGKILRTQTTTANAGSVDSLDYRIGEKCATDCYGRKANQAPKVRREKK